MTMQAKWAMYAKLLVISWIALLCWGCGPHESKPHDLSNQLQGTWVLAKSVTPDHHTIWYPDSDGNTQVQVFDGDSISYVGSLSVLKEAFAIVPQVKYTYRIDHRGGGTPLYFENGFKRPLRLINDTTLLLQKNGVRFTLVRTRGFVKAHDADVLSIFRSHRYTEGENRDRYVISKTEQELRKTNYTLWFSFGVLLLVVLVIVIYCWHVRRRNQRLREKLDQIAEKQRLRPEKLTKALKEVESDYFQSDDYC